MSDTERVRAWLQGFAGMPEDLRVDWGAPEPDTGGLYPQGMEPKSVRTDILGRRRVLCRQCFALHLTFLKGEGGATDTKRADWLARFAHWVEAQSAAGTAPQLGDFGPERERVWAEEARYTGEADQGVGRYSVRLCAEYQKRYGG